MDCSIDDVTDFKNDFAFIEPPENPPATHITAFKDLFSPNDSTSFDSKWPDQSKRREKWTNALTDGLVLFVQGLSTCKNVQMRRRIFIWRIKFSFAQPRLYNWFLSNHFFWFKTNIHKKSTHNLNLWTHFYESKMKSGTKSPQISIRDYKIESTKFWMQIGLWRLFVEHFLL